MVAVVYKVDFLLVVVVSRSRRTPQSWFGSAGKLFKFRLCSECGVLSAAFRCPSLNGVISNGVIGLTQPTLATVFIYLVLAVLLEIINPVLTRVCV